ncbi:MAG: hypothetical protein ACRDZ3_01430 [Acidimicrobiia bacterium]
MFGHHRYVANEDHTLFWAAARDIGRLDFFQPHVYGQSYGVIIEAAPTEILRWVGVSLPTALPLVTAAFMVGCWLVLAVTAGRRRPLLALTALAAPVVISTAFLVGAQMPSRTGGMFIATVGAAALLRSRGRPVLVGLGTGLAGLGVMWDLGAALLVLPLLGFAVLRERRCRAALLAGAAGLVPALLWTAATAGYYRSRPYMDLHQAAVIRLDLDILAESSQHLGRYFRPLAPQLLPYWWLPIAALVCVVAVLLARRRFAAATAGLAGMAGVAATLATPKALDGTASAYLGYGRLLFAVPLLVWCLAWLAGEDRPPAPAGRTRRALAFAGVAVLAGSLVTASWRAGRFEDHLGEIDRVATEVRVAAVVPVQGVVQRCEALNETMGRVGATLAVFLTDRIAAYACAGQWDEAVSLFPAYERRTWLLDGENRVPRSVFVVADAPPDWCRHLADSVRSCAPADLPGTMVVRMDAQPALPVLAAAGVPVRPTRDYPSGANMADGPQPPSGE